MDILFIADHRYIQTRVAIASLTCSVKKVTLFFTLDKKFAKRLHQIIQDTARSYGLYRIKRTVDLRPSSCQSGCIQMQYEIIDYAEKMDNILCKGGFLYRKYLCKPF